MSDVTWDKKVDANMVRCRDLIDDLYKENPDDITALLYCLWVTLTRHIAAMGDVSPDTMAAEALHHATDEARQAGVVR
jgi:hypothetical protein